MAISDSTLNSNVWTEVKNIIVAATPKVGTKVASVKASYNDESTSKPIIILYPAETSEDQYKFGSPYGKRFINVTVECIYKNTTGIDELADTVETAIRTATIDGMELVAVSSDYAFVNPNESKFHLKSITFTFDRE